MNQTSSFQDPDSLAYVLLDAEFKIKEYSELLRQYSEEFSDLNVGEDVRQSFPELVGLEQVCSEILANRQDKFVLESVAREQEDEIVYFDIKIQALEDRLILILNDVTEITSLKQSFIQQANEQELTVSALKRFEYCTNRIINSMGELLFITDSIGRIERINYAVSKTLGYKKSQLIRSPMETFLAGAGLKFADVYDSLVRQKYSIQKIETVITSKQGQEIEVEFNCFATPTEIPDLYSCVFVGRDITLRKQAEREMMQALAKEKELRELKSRFISMASHEFRNPLSSILICSDMLSRDDDTISADSRSFYLQLIKESALNIQSILEDVLVLSRAEATKQELKISCFDLEEFISQIIRQIGLSYQDRTINLSCNCQDTQYCGDTKLLWHIFSNIICNAVKYSAVPEVVEVSIEIENNCYSIEISDRGIGIPEAAQKHLFESFYRANNVGKTPGTGLGLAIVKRAIDLHKGSIEIDSKVNYGTTIKLLLPIEIEPA